MKKFLQYTLLFILLTFSGIILTNQESAREYIQDFTGINRPCSKPIEYSIGEIDPRFGISKNELIETIAQAEKVWENSAGKNIFEYNQNAELKINLIFDERQRQVNEANKLENKLENLNSAHDLAADKYSSLAQSYKTKLSSYNKKASEYEKELKEYNNDVSYWNSHGGTSEDEYKKLQEKKKDLEKLYNELEKERKELNALTDKTNQAAVKENKIVEEYNANLNTYKNKFGEAREFEKGVFDGKSINIYEFEEKSDLGMTLIHEMGHALGIGHLNDPTSIMYYLMGEQDLENPSLTSEDISALKAVCKMN